MASKPKVIVLASRSAGARFIVSRIAELADIRQIIWQERRRSQQWKLLKRRARRFGVWYPFSRLTLALYLKLCGGQARRGCREWQMIHGTDPDVLAHLPQDAVFDINAPQVKQYLNSTPHDLVIVSGTAILKKETIEASHCVVNTHAGITPEYRGAHGGFWAVINGDYLNAGQTLHFIDEGIDTGGIITQCRIELSPSDTLETLAAKHTVAAGELLTAFLTQYTPPFKQAPTIAKPDSSSQLYYSPGLCDYFRFQRAIRNVPVPESE